MTDTEHPPAVTLSAEELAKLKENYVIFCNRIAAAKDQLNQMDAALKQGETEPVMELWHPLKSELEVLNTMALQLNKGDYGPLVREQLESLFDACETIYQAVLDAETADAETRQKAQAAYRPDQQN